MVLHALPAGAAFDLTTRSLIPQPVEVDAEDPAELAEAARDLRGMARDIAAADASPARCAGAWPAANATDGVTP